VIQGYTGQLDMWLGRTAFEPTSIERLDAIFAGGDCPPAIVVFVDAWTSRGGSQFLNSTSTGRYLDYLCDEVVAFVDSRYPTAPMLRPDIFGAFASHAGDALFECCYAPEFPGVARALRDRFEGSYEVFHERFAQASHFDWARFGTPLEMYGYACCYTPDPDRPGHARLPFEIETGKLIEPIWNEWLALDPVRMVPRHAEALSTMRRIYLDAGRSDEAFLDLGAQAVSTELTKIGIEHTLELFEGRHGGIAYRYPGAIQELVLALD
jgi:hypothetical protein